MFEKFNLLWVKCINLLGVLFLVLMICAMLVGIFFRYIILKPIFWIEEFVRFMFIWNIYIGAIIASRERKHPTIDLFVNLLQHKIKKIVLISVSILLLIQSVIITYVGLKVTIQFKMVKTIALGIPWSLIYFVVPFSFFMIFIEDIINIKNKKERL